MVDYPSTCPVTKEALETELLGNLEALRAHQQSVAMDDCEAVLLTLPPAECPLEHFFVGGFYVRQIRMAAGTMVASRIHKTRHCYCITQGEVSVWIDGQVKRLKAPFSGITEPGTRRLLFIHSDVIWTTFHPNPDDCRDVDEIVNRVTENHLNETLGIHHNEIPDFLRALKENQ